MADIKKILETKRNGLNVNLFEFDIDNEANFNELKAYLINKVKVSKVHNIEEYNLTYYVPKNLNPEFVAKFNAQIAKINIPKKAKKPQFDVRRERVTEWMAQYLLEQEFGCLFYDEADKRINLKTVEIDKHTDGIDVPGIWLDDGQIKFVVCEVKASEEKNIPCSSMKPLQEDIQKAVENTDNRVSREILEYMHGIREAEIQDELFQRIVVFLAELIGGERRDLADNIMFFPFLLRNNGKIISESNTDDFKKFSLNRVQQENVQNIIAVFEQDFSIFSDGIYEQALGE